MSEVGEKNAYHCERCGRYTVVVHVDAGVTPMFLACRQIVMSERVRNGDAVSPRTGEDLETCGGKGVSMMYPAEPWPSHVPTEPEYEWYMPDAETRKMQAPEMREHYDMGGLELRLIGETEPSRIPGRRMMTRKERRQTKRNTRKRGRGFTK